MPRSVHARDCTSPSPLLERRAPGNHDASASPCIARRAMQWESVGIGAFLAQLSIWDIVPCAAPRPLLLFSSSMQMIMKLRHGVGARPLQQCILEDTLRMRASPAYTHSPQRRGAAHCSSANEGVDQALCIDFAKEIALVCSHCVRGTYGSTMRQASPCG